MRFPTTIAQIPMGGPAIVARPDAQRRLQRTTLTSIHGSRAGRRVIARGSWARLRRLERTFAAELGVTAAGKLTYRHSDKT